MGAEPAQVVLQRHPSDAQNYLDNLVKIQMTWLCSESLFKLIWDNDRFVIFNKLSKGFLVQPVWERVECRVPVIYIPCSRPCYLLFRKLRDKLLL